VTAVRTVLKLGGSVLTHKSEPETVDEASLEQVCDTIAAFLDREAASLVIVHGGGSFGHHHAAACGLSTVAGTHDATAVTTVHRAMCALNDRVIDALQERGVSAVPVRPLSVAHRSERGLQFPAGALEAMLEEGFVPVTHGDVVVHERTGATVLSGDDIVVSLARSLKAERIGLCSTVPGVIDDDGEVVDAIDSYEAVAAVLGESEATDVTGGMAHKVRQLLALESPACIFDPASLELFLDTGRAGTVIDGRENTAH